MKQNIFLSFPEFEFTRQELAEWNGYKHWCDIIVTYNITFSKHKNNKGLTLFIIVVNYTSMLENQQITQTQGETEL
jgi:hypothetical protein